VPQKFSYCIVVVCQYPEGWQDGKESEESTKPKGKGSRGAKRKRKVLSDDDDDNNNEGKHYVTFRGICLEMMSSACSSVDS